MKKKFIQYRTETRLNPKKFAIRSGTCNNTDSLIFVTPRYENNLVKISSDNRKLIKEVQLIDLKMHNILHNNLDNYMMLFKVDLNRLIWLKSKKS